MTVTIEEAQSNLSELIDRLAPGEELVITRGDSAVARLVSERCEPPPIRAGFGGAKGHLVILADDDEHLADWRDYM